MSGVHGEERAGPIAIQQLMKQYPSKFEDVWVLPILNIHGYVNQYRFNNYEFNLNTEFTQNTKLKFMKELMDILSNIDKPKLFVDLHEDSESDIDYVWASLQNKPEHSDQVRKFCKETDTGLMYWPDIKYYEGSSETFARNLGIDSCYTPETTLNKPLIDRVNKHIKYLKFFLSL